MRKNELAMMKVVFTFVYVCSYIVYIKRSHLVTGDNWTLKRLILKRLYSNLSSSQRKEEDGARCTHGFK